MDQPVRMLQVQLVQECAIVIGAPGRAFWAQRLLTEAHRYQELRPRSRQARDQVIFRTLKQ
jgi:hypothetical protein